MSKLSIEMLMKLDRDKMKEVPTAEAPAARLSELLGEKVTVKVKALSGDQYTELMATSRGKKGTTDISKVFRAQALVVVEGVVEPSLKDKDLQVHFGAASPVELAKILFPGGELVDVFKAIADISGFLDDEDDDEEDTVKEVKN